MRRTKTPGTPSFGIICPLNEYEKISPEKENSIVLVFKCWKYFHPDIANAVKELSKALDTAYMLA